MAGTADKTWRRVSAVLALVLCATLGWNATLQNELEQARIEMVGAEREENLGERSDKSRRTVVRPENEAASNPGVGVAVAGNRGDGGPRVVRDDLSGDEALEEQIARRVEAQLNERMEGKRRSAWDDHRDQIYEGLEDMVEEREVGEEDAALLFDAFEEMEADIRSLREEIDDGALPRHDAREEFLEARRDFGDVMVDILGEEAAQELREGMEDPRSRHEDEGGEAGAGAGGGPP